MAQFSFVFCFVLLCVSDGISKGRTKWFNWLLCLQKIKRKKEKKTDPLELTMFLTFLCLLFSMLILLPSLNRQWIFISKHFHFLKRCIEEDIYHFRILFWTTKVKLIFWEQMIFMLMKWRKHLRNGS